MEEVRGKKGEKKCGDFSAYSPVHPAVNGYPARSTYALLTTVVQVGFCYSTGPDFRELCTGTPCSFWLVEAAPYICFCFFCDVRMQRSFQYGFTFSAT